MDEKAKQPYVKVHAKDQERHDREMAQFNKTGYFTNKDGVCSSTLKAKVKKSLVEMPVVPKKACSPYTFYVKAHAKSCMEKNNNCAMTQAASILSKEWNSLSDAKKKPYLDLSAKDLQRHQKQVADLEKLGFFTLEDGTKSTSLKPKMKKVLKKRSRISAPAQEEEDIA